MADIVGMEGMDGIEGIEGLEEMFGMEEMLGMDMLRWAVDGTVVGVIGVTILDLFMHFSM